MMRILVGIVWVLSILGCTNSEPIQNIDEKQYQAQPYVKISHPNWTKNASIYQLNIRQFTSQGTFIAATQRLDEIKSMGFDILWLMPIHPIGEEKRKGSLGSPYSVKDYYAVNPEFGSEQDLKNLIKTAHELGMYVILDWVANHTAWDNPLRFEHPQWYERDHDGNFRPTPWWDWSDIIDLDFTQSGVREYMTEAMKYWVEHYDIDGYRCDVAGFVPLDFWNNVRYELDKIKPVFMLAEWEMRDLHAEAFDMTYAWTWEQAMHHVIQHQGELHKLFYYYSWNESAYPKDALRMTFVTNHDMNAWDGSVFERYGEATEAAIVLSIVGEGMPLAYNGLEAGNSKRLAFFERDPIVWHQHHFRELFSKYNELLRTNSALWHGRHGATMIRVYNSKPDKVFSFVRQNPQDKVFAIFNFTAEEQTVSFDGTLHQGEYTEYATGDKVSISSQTSLNVPAWGYSILVR